MKPCRISVLMPAYNAQKYIAPAIESILNQTFTDFEFIIINDGSTDDTARIIRDYAKRDDRIRFIDNAKNIGMIGVLNQGLDLCRGEYIARMDADDLSVPDRFELQVAYMDAHPDVGVLGGYISQFGDTLKHPRLYTYPASITLMDLFLYGCQFAHPTALIRASVMRKNNIYYDKSFPHAEDFGLWARLAQCTAIHNLPTVLLHYRWHETNVSQIYNKTQADSAERVRELIVASLTDKPDDAKRLLDVTRADRSYFWLMGMIPVIRRKKYGLVKTKYLIFGKIPLFRVQDNKVYIFDRIPIGHFK